MNIVPLSEQRRMDRLLVDRLRMYLGKDPLYNQERDDQEAESSYFMDAGPPPPRNAAFARDVIVDHYPDNFERSADFNGPSARSAQRKALRFEEPSL